jgi:hypothetical protein
MADKANKLYGKAIELSKRFDERFLELARTLRDLKTIAPDLFGLCVENSRISLRKAYYLLEVVDTFEKLHVSEKRLQAIGWTKLAVIAKHVTKGNVKEALKLAENASTRDLKAWVNGEWPEEKPHCVLMYMTAAQYTAFTDALLTFGAKRGRRGLVDKEKALTEFIAYHNELVAFLRQELPGDGAEQLQTRAADADTTKLYLARHIESRRAVGIFWCENEEELRTMVGEDHEPAQVEYCEVGDSACLRWEELSGPTVGVEEMDEEGFLPEEYFEAFKRTISWDHDFLYWFGEGADKGDHDPDPLWHRL